ncbi:hypothetical protein Tsubulata_049272 [Turnera subulata]|uniref:Uncharacterized protein n=1 Tax=Turnera subulata TaxID=218843 RepID=A0A9Q0FRH0_9ROSI|nr:hypothetical protein Tsubulata_049272 [Turnera subulata]
MARKYKVRASRPDLKVEVRGSAEVELGLKNGMVDGIFFIPGYNLHESVIDQRFITRVVDGNDAGVEDVKIIVPGPERATTDKEGHYKLNQVVSNHHTIESEKEHYNFKKLKEYMILETSKGLITVE